MKQGRWQKAKMVPRFEHLEDNTSLKIGDTRGTPLGGRVNSTRDIQSMMPWLGVLKEVSHVVYAF